MSLKAQNQDLNDMEFFCNFHSVWQNLEQGFDSQNKYRRHKQDRGIQDDTAYKRRKCASISFI